MNTANKIAKTHITRNKIFDGNMVVERNLWKLDDGRFGVQTWLRLPHGSSHQDGWVYFDDRQRAENYTNRDFY